jgi:hypothetical protein
LLASADILAGPILRRVQQDLVAVWIALTCAAKVEIEIFRGLGPAGTLGPSIAARAASFPRDTHTLAAGAGLHIAVSIWQPDNVAGLEWGGLYSYDVVITPDDGSGTVRLHDLGLLSDTIIHAHDTDHQHLALGYQQDWLPSFAVPPANPSDLKMVQGSCRGSNGLGRDALPPLDDLLRTLVTDPLRRPHQMYLTGDQVYSDEGAAEFVEMLQTMAGELLGGTAGSSVENVAVEFAKTDTEPAETFNVLSDTKNFPPGRRGHLMTDVAHFTSDHTDSHAISFGEFCGNYLTGWCNIPWKWNALALLNDRATRFTDYITNTEALYKLLINADISIHDDSIGDSVKAAKEMLKYFNSWRLVPTAYRDIDKYLTQDDIAKAWGKDNTDDGPRYNLWQQIWSALKPGDKNLPADPAVPFAAAPADDHSRQMNRFARALSPSWYAGNEIFRVDFDYPSKDEINSGTHLKTHNDDVYNRVHRLEWFYRDLPRVRRLLANIPTYMVFDDHEITDDWNISPKWAKTTRSSALARATIRNGLAAFTLFQHWGNDPLAYRPGAVGATVLDTIESMFRNASAVKPGPDPAAAASLEKLFDLVLVQPLPASDRMHWDFRYDGPKFEVLALDSRTWRGFEEDANDMILEPFYDEDTAALLTDQAMRMQIPDQPGAGINPDGLCIVIAAAPFLGFPAVESIGQPLINLFEMTFREPSPPFKRWKRSFNFGRVAHDPETWGYRPRLFEAMLARLATRNRVIFFSGDVHYSFSSQMDYWILNPDGSKKSSTRFVQLTASSMRAQQPKVPYVFSIDLLQQLGAVSSKQVRYGWTRGAVGTATGDPPIDPGQLAFTQHLSHALIDDPILVSPEGVPPDAIYRRQPEWIWQMELASDKRLDADRFMSPPPPDFSNNNQTELLNSVGRRHVWHARYSMPRKWHWWTNFTIVGFQPGPDGFPGEVDFSVYSYDPEGTEPSAEPFFITKIDLTIPGTPPVVIVEPS